MKPRGYLINYQIRAKEVRLIDFDGTQLGVLPLEQAIAKAKEMELDLILVAPSETAPVCKIGDYGRFKYEIEKREKEARKAHKVGGMKEIKLSPKIDIHDLNVRIARSSEFLKKGHRLKVTMMFRGREITHKAIGEGVVNKFLEGVKEFGSAEGPKKFEGKNLVLMVVPIKGREIRAQS